MAQSMVETASVLKEALGLAHWIMDGTMADVDQELANRQPAGAANSIGSTYMHFAFSEDWFVNNVIRQQAKLAEATFEGRTGADKPEPPMGQGLLGDWYHTVRVDIDQAREYARAVTHASEEAVGALSESELVREVDLGFYKGSLAACIEMFLTGHCNCLCGEISAIKGTFGLKGYPF